MVTMATKMPSSLGFTTFFNKIIDGRESAVTPIINDNAVPIPTPFKMGKDNISKCNSCKHRKGRAYCVCKWNPFLSDKYEFDPEDLGKSMLYELKNKKMM